MRCTVCPLVFVQSVDSSVGGLSRSSTVASLDTDSTRSSGNWSSSSHTPLDQVPFEKVFAAHTSDHFTDGQSSFNDHSINCVPGLDQWN